MPKSKWNVTTTTRTIATMTTTNTMTFSRELKLELLCFVVRPCVFYPVLPGCIDLLPRSCRFSVSNITIHQNKTHSTLLSVFNSK